MSYVTPIGLSPRQIAYYLDAAHGCSTSTDATTGAAAPLTGDPERPLRWIGEGLDEVGIEAGSELRPDQYWQAISLLNGIDPRTGERLIDHKLEVPADAKLPVAPLIRAVLDRCTQDGTTVEDALKSKRLIDMFRRAERALQRRGEVASLRADHAGELADRAGADIDTLWGTDEFRTALGNLTETYHTLGHDGSVVTQTVPRRITTGNAGYGVTLTLPKHDSLLLTLASREVADRIEDLYTRQIGRVFGWLEGNCAYGMRGHHGDGKTAERIEGSGFLGWVMTHRAARPTDGAFVGDPHWHVHIAIANMTRGTDGDWSTVAAGGRDLMRHIAPAEAILHATIRHQLHRTYGVVYARNPRTGAWQIAGIPDALLRHFSKRGVHIEALLGDLGFEPGEASAAARRIAKSRGRRVKTDDATAATDLTLRQWWRDEARAAGFNLDATATDVFRGGIMPPTPDLEQLTAIVTDPDAGVTAHMRRCTRLDVIAAIAHALPAGADIDTLEQLADQVLARTAFRTVSKPAAESVTAGSGARPNRAASHMSNATLYTTRDILDAEAVILSRALGSQATPTGALLSTDQADMAIAAIDATARFPLDDEQRQAVTRLLTHDTPVDTIEGGPGAGKTTMLCAARVGWESVGFRVAGASTQAVASHNLLVKSGIESRSIAQWKWAIANRDGLTGVDVLVVDEAGMTNDRDRAVLYQEAQRTGTRIIEVGDRGQLRGVGCGSMFGYLHDHLRGASLTNNRRQADADERAAIAAWRAGRYVEALQTWANKQHLVVTETADEATAEMIATWIRQRAGCPDPHLELRALVMLAGTNDQVDRLNAAAQAVRARLGQTGHHHDYHLLAGRSLRLHVGDHVMLRINSRGQRLHIGDTDDVFNGYRGVVDRIASDGTISVSWHSDSADGPVLESATFDATYVAVGGVDLGYAMTIHKSQGLTVAGDWTRPDGTEHHGTVLTHAPGVDNNGLHVATSRHAQEVWLFGSRQELETPQDELVDGLPATDTDRIQRAIDKLAARAEQTEDNANDHPVLDELAGEDNTAVNLAEKISQRLTQARPVAADPPRRGDPRTSPPPTTTPRRGPSASR